MGRTIPSFTLAVLDAIEEWKPFRKPLDKSSDRKAYDANPKIVQLFLHLFEDDQS